MINIYKDPLNDMKTAKTSTTGSTKPKTAPKEVASKAVAAKAPKVTATKAKTSVKEVTAKAPAAPKAVRSVSPAPKKVTRKPLAHGVGRRKSSVARVWLRAGRGEFLVNGKPVLSYFDTEVNRGSALAPWTLVPHLVKEFDTQVNVVGGGMNSQADAVKLGIARALIELRDDAREILRTEGLLTVDSRVKERKKYGQPGARRKFQFVKR